MARRLRRRLRPDGAGAPCGASSCSPSRSTTRTRCGCTSWSAPRSSTPPAPMCGTVAAVLANPADDLLELDGGALVPVTFVVGWDDDRRVVIDPPDGLLDRDRAGAPCPSVTTPTPTTEPARATPTALVDELVAGGTVDVLDVGCGTGKLGRLLAGAGLPRARRRARRAHGRGRRRPRARVEVAPFESWDDAGRRFDLVVAAQAWHWIDADVGARRAAEVLRLGRPARRRVEPDPAHAGGQGCPRRGLRQRLAPALAASAAVGLEVADEPLAGVDETGAFGFAGAPGRSAGSRRTRRRRGSISCRRTATTGSCRSTSGRRCSPVCVTRSTRSVAA